jgi:hypothetical protein
MSFRKLLNRDSTAFQEDLKVFGCMVIEKVRLELNFQKMFCYIKAVLHAKD